MPETCFEPSPSSDGSRPRRPSGPVRGRRRLAARIAACTLASLATSAHAILTCDLDGKSVSPSNGATTEGKTGLMRCRDADSGQLQREQELKNGKFIGLVRFFENGQLKIEYRENERGNRDGLVREWQPVAAGAKPVLILEETARDGSTVGLSKSWFASGTLRRLTFYGDGGPEKAFVEYGEDGKLRSLRCATEPVFGRDFDDRAACGFGGAPVTTVLYARGQPVERITLDRGKRAKSEELWDNGAVRELRETTATGAVARSFAADGTKRHEVQSTAFGPPSASGAPRLVTTRDQEYHESGRLTRERRWQPTERDRDLVEETTWYLNGQPKAETRIVAGPQGGIRREKTYYDNGTLASEGDWLGTKSRGDRDERAIGTHRSYDERGRKRGEQVYDDRGKLTREREFDESGAVVRDDELFEDGSRKAVGR